MSRYSLPGTTLPLTHSLTSLVILPAMMYSRAIANLYDSFGPGIASPEVQALVASEETAGRLELANKLRRERGFPPLDLVVVDLLMAEDAKPISSTRIRKGEIDEEGRVLRTRGRKGI